jgi:hypothetical protein
MSIGGRVYSYSYGGSRQIGEEGACAVELRDHLDAGPVRLERQRDR